MCSKCEGIFSVVHSMTDKLNKCDICDNVGTVEIVPSILYTTQKVSEKKPGELVKQYIKDTKEYIEEQKQGLIKDLKNDY